MNLKMTLEEYQEKARQTVQTYGLTETQQNIIPFLGIVGEAGSVLSELKKHLRDGKHYEGFGKNLAEELGDVLWYVAAIAKQHDLKLEDIAQVNLQKTADRFLPVDESNFKNYDEKNSKAQKFPEELEIEFVPTNEDVPRKVKIINRITGEQIGDDLSDNSREDDGYRFHDIFHYGYMAYLGWSPVLRKLLNAKRKDDPVTDAVEDGARATITEELISLFIYEHAIDHKLFKYSKSIDTDLLKNIKRLTRVIEINDCSAKQWEQAILASYEVFHELRANDGGRVMVSLKNRKLTYLGKK